MREPTVQQARVLSFVSRHSAAYGRPPTMREIVTHMGFASDNASYEHVMALVKKGLMTRTPKKARGIRVIETADLNWGGIRARAVEEAES